MFGKIKEALSLERWIENFEGYLDARMELAKYDIREALVGLLVKAVFIAGMAFFGLLALVCLNFGLAFWLNTLLESSFAGFLLLGAFYLLLTLVIYLGKESPAMQEKAEAAFRNALDQPKKEEQKENQSGN